MEKIFSVSLNRFQLYDVSNFKIIDLKLVLKLLMSTRIWCICN